jgi:RNA polymerase primary sigma factor
MRQLKINPSVTSRESLSVEKYLQEIAKLDLLTPEQEVDLARLIKQGSKVALETLVNANLRFVVSVAKQYQNQGLSLNDLINEGNMGLIKAAQRFDETKGFKFISYAVWWIRQSIMQALMQNSRMIRLPLNKIDAYQKMLRELAKFQQAYERNPTDEELATTSGIPLKDVQELLKVGGRHISIDAPIDESDDTSDSFIDSLEDLDMDTPDNDLLSESLRIEISKVFSTLNEREVNVLTHYYGLNGVSAISLEDIADKFDLTRERVRQIKEKAIRRLRKTSRLSALKTYL